MPSISIVIPALDEAAALPDTLAALAAQLDIGDEIWVVDGGSRDGTADVAAAWAAVLRSAPPRGRQLNEGAGRAGGDLLLFLHADCRLPFGALAAVRASLTDASVGGGCFLVSFPPEQIARAPRLRWIAAGINARTRALRQGTGDQGLFTRRETFRAVGGFPEWPLMEDIELCRRLKRVGEFRVLEPPLETSARRWLQGGILRTQLRMWGLRAAYLAGVNPTALGRGYTPVR